jgi:hypothetical protein
MKQITELEGDNAGERKDGKCCAKVVLGKAKLVLVSCQELFQLKQ